jgi:hypothetical protein
VLLKILHYTIYLSTLVLAYASQGFRTSSTLSLDSIQTAKMKFAVLSFLVATAVAHPKGT